MKNLVAFFVIIAIFFASCNDHIEEINRLNTELHGVTDTLELCQSWQNYRVNRIDTLNQAIQEHISEIYKDSIEMVNYFSDHKMAVACIAAGYVGAKVKTDFNTDYPQVVEDLAGWGIVLAIGYYLFNKDLVDEVCNKSVQADNKKKQQYSEIETYQQTILEEKRYLADIGNLETMYQSRASTLRLQIDSFKN